MGRPSFHFKKRSAQNFRQQGAQILPVGGTLGADAKVRLANLKAAACGDGGNRCQGIALNTTPPAGILSENSMDKLS